MILKDEVFSIKIQHLQFSPLEVKAEVVDRWIAQCQEQGGQWKALKLQGGNKYRVRNAVLCHIFHITRSSKDECSTGSNNHFRSIDLFRSLGSIGQMILIILHPPFAIPFAC